MVRSMAEAGGPEAMDERQAAERMSWLGAELERHNHLYYVQARPEISDRDFDGLDGRTGGAGGPVP